MQRILWTRIHLAAQSSKRIRQVELDDFFLLFCSFSLQTISQDKYTVGEDATKLFPKDSCPTLLYNQFSGGGVNLPQTHVFATELAFCATSAAMHVGRGKLIRGERLVWSSKQKTHHLLSAQRHLGTWSIIHLVRWVPLFLLTQLLSHSFIPSFTYNYTKKSCYLNRILLSFCLCLLVCCIRKKETIASFDHSIDQWQ